MATAHAASPAAALNTAAKRFTSAVCLVPPRTTWAALQEVRCFNDKSFCRWPPHVNLLYPFLEEQHFPAAAQAAAEALASLSSFQVQRGDATVGRGALSSISQPEQLHSEGNWGSCAAGDAIRVLALCARPELHAVAATRPHRRWALLAAHPLADRFGCLWRILRPHRMHALPPA